MGSSYIIEMTCPYCETDNDDIYFAPSSEMTSHRCYTCKKEFDIEMTFMALPKKEEFD